MPDRGEEPRELVEWRRLARRVLVAAAVVTFLAAVVATVLAVVSGGSVGGVAAFAAIAVAGLLVTVVAVVAWSALGGMLRAGDVGERLSSRDVGLLPPQARSRRRRRSRQVER